MNDTGGGLRPVLEEENKESAAILGFMPEICDGVEKKLKRQTVEIVKTEILKQEILKNFSDISQMYSSLTQ